MHGKLFLFFFLLLGSLAARAQTTTSVEEKAFEKNYHKRIQKEYLFGVYIPKDLTDVFIQLNQLIDKKDRQKFKSLDEEMAAQKLHFSFGRWMIHNWGFYEGSRLSHFLRKLGITHPDDMARFLIVSYHRNLNKKELRVKEQIEFYQNYRKEQLDARKKKGTVIHEEIRKKEKN